MAGTSAARLSRSTSMMLPDPASAGSGVPCSTATRRHGGSVAVRAAFAGFPRSVARQASRAPATGRELVGGNRSSRRCLRRRPSAIRSAAARTIRPDGSGRALRLECGDPPVAARRAGRGQGGQAGGRLSRSRRGASRHFEQGGNIRGASMAQAGWSSGLPGYHPTLAREFPGAGDGVVSAPGGAVTTHPRPVI